MLLTRRFPLVDGRFSVSMTLLYAKLRKMRCGTYLICQPVMSTFVSFHRYQSSHNIEQLYIIIWLIISSQILGADNPDESNVNSDNLKGETDNQKLDAYTFRFATFDQMTASNSVTAFTRLLDTKAKIQSKRNSEFQE